MLHIAGNYLSESYLLKDEAHRERMLKGGLKLLDEVLTRVRFSELKEELTKREWINQKRRFERELSDEEKRFAEKDPLDTLN